MSGDLHHLAAAYALDALESDERERFEAHYPTCDICSREVAEFREVAAALADSTAESPPAALRTQVLDEVGRTRQMSPVARLGDAPRARRAPWQLLATAAAALVLAGVGAIVWANRGSDRVSELVAAPDAVVTTLEGSAGSVQVVWSDERDQVAVIGSDLADPGQGLTYALWVLRADGVTPAGLFVPEDGSVRRVLDIDDAETTGWGVTIEPEGGSPQPTGDVLYAGTI